MESNKLAPLIGLGAVGLGAYLLLREREIPEEEEPEEPEWLPANTELARAEFSVIIGKDLIGWLSANTELAREGFSVQIVESEWKAANTELARKEFSAVIVKSDWFPANTELARAPFSVIVTTAYTLTAQVIPSGAGSVSGVGIYKADTYATLTATPIYGYDFAYWSGDADGTSPTVKVLMNRDKRVYATFREKVTPKYTLTLAVSPAGAGTVTGAGTYEEGWVAIGAYAASGYEFSHWGGDFTGQYPSASLYLSFDKYVTAYFKPKVAPAQFSLSTAVDPSGSGWVAKDPNKSLYDYGEIVEVEAFGVSDSFGSYVFRFWTCDGVWLDSNNPIDFMITDSHTLKAYFRWISN